MRANALRAWAEVDGGWDVAIHQALESTHPLYAFGVGVYNVIQNTLPIAHHVYFQGLELAQMHASSRRILGADHFRARVAEHQPDLVVSTHAHLNHGFFELVRQEMGTDRVRCVTYCGELWGGYGFSRHWVNPHADAFIGAVGPCRQQAIDLGMLADRATVGGFLLRPDFFREEEDHNSPRTLLSDELALDPSQLTVLLSTGAVGANNHLALLHCLEARRRPIQAVVLCGDQATVREKVVRWGERAVYTRVRALPRREDMPRLIRGVDLLVARPGTGTTSEAVLCGTPIAFNCIGGVMPQECLTLKFAHDRGFGATLAWPHDLARLLNMLDRQPQVLDAMRQAAVRSRPTQHPRGILNYLKTLSERSPGTERRSMCS